MAKIRVTAPNSATASSTYRQPLIVVLSLGTALLFVILYGSALVRTSPAISIADTAWKTHTSYQTVAYEDENSVIYSAAGQSHLAAAGLDPRGLAPLSVAFQAFLHEHQHPASCADRDFLVFPGWGAGLGSEVHVAGHHLLCAQKLGLVFLWSDSAGSSFTEGPANLDDKSGGTPFSSVNVSCDGAVGMTCLFRPPSNCSLADARGRPAPPSDALSLCMNADDVDALLPAWVVAQLKAAGLATPAVRKYWVRAQTAAYVMRLSDATLAAVRELRTRPGLLVAPGAPFPLPRGSVAVHMRQGDKAKDMGTLIKGARYGQLASSVLDWTTPLHATSRLLLAITDGAEALSDLERWRATLRPKEGRPVLVYVSDAVLPRVDLGREARVELADGSRPALWLSRLYLLQACIHGGGGAG